jgi:hypothetical protein
LRVPNAVGRIIVQQARSARAKRQNDGIAVPLADKTGAARISLHQQERRAAGERGEARVTIDFGARCKIPFSRLPLPPVVFHS